MSALKQICKPGAPFSERSDSLLWCHFKLSLTQTLCAPWNEFCLSRYICWEWLHGLCTHLVLLYAFFVITPIILCTAKQRRLHLKYIPSCAHYINSWGQDLLFLIKIKKFAWTDLWRRGRTDVQNGPKGALFLCTICAQAVHRLCADCAQIVRRY